MPKRNGLPLGSSFRVICLEFGRKCQSFEENNDLWMLFDDADKRQVELDGIGVYDLVDRPDYKHVTAIVYEILIYDGVDAKRFSKTTAFRHDFKEDVRLDDDYPLRLLCDTNLFDLYVAKDVVLDVDNLDGDLPQFVA